MTYAWRHAVRESLPAIVGAVLAVAGFAIMRVSAIYESWLLLFVSFVFMVWGIVMIFTGGWRPRTETWGTETDASR